jgi:hypothetical protein
MTQQEYAAYQKAVANFLEREGVTELTTDPGSEPFFSWRPCECCGTHFGGNRESAAGYSPVTKKVYHYDICVDCVYYMAYGRLDDQGGIEQ